MCNILSQSRWLNLTPFWFLDQILPPFQPLLWHCPVGVDGEKEHKIILISKNSHVSKINYDEKMIYVAFNGFQL